MNTILANRARAVRARALVKCWEYRQRNLSKGVWFRVRRFLAFAAEAYTVSDEEMVRLLAEGLRPDPVGREIEPQKILLRISRERLRSIRDPNPIPVAIGPGFLAARAVVTVGFDQANAQT